MTNLLSSLLTLTLSVVSGSMNTPVPVPLQLETLSEAHRLYEKLELGRAVDLAAFEKAYAGFQRIEERDKDVLTVIDFTKPSSEERMCVVDMNKEELLFITHVSHGAKSGEKYATSFSNVLGSHQSSLGFFLTEYTYQGKAGYSLVINGLEEGINDRAKARAVVIHGAKYADPKVIAYNGRLGRSLGCPALPPQLNKPVIDAIKNGSVLYIHGSDDVYLSQSPILSPVYSDRAASRA